MMKMRFILLIIFLSFLCGSLSAQDKYWLNLNPTLVELEYENINPAYLDFLSDYEIEPIKTSLWLNAISALIDLEKLDKIAEHEIVLNVQPVEELYFQSLKPSLASDGLFNERALEALGLKYFETAGLSGEGVKIGVLDAGFMNYESSSISDVSIGGMNNFINSGNTDLDSPATYDFIDERPEKLRDMLKWIKGKIYHSHGTQAAENIAGDSEIGRGGLSPNATLYLGRSEEGMREYKAEEDHWIAGLEWLHENGVRLVNTSLGYSKKRENRANNYKPSDMNGSSMIARAAQKAVEEKDMILVISAGNEGKKMFWRVISTPADARDVISVGATKPHSFLKEDYSSIGPDFIDYVKPDVSAISPTGTSFSAPLITGFIGCMLEKKPDLSASEVKSLLQRSSQLFPFKNNYVGYGLPQADKMLALLDEAEIEVHESREVTVKGSKYILPQEKNKFITLFHKKDAYYVKHQERIEAIGGEFIIKKKKGAKRTTVLHGRKVIEIYWD